MLNAMPDAWCPIDLKRTQKHDVASLQLQMFQRVNGER